jgi:hypothetical protein
MAEAPPQATGASKRPIALVFHAEKLHADHVWREVEKVAHRLAARDVRATFFVYSFPAAVAAVDITARLRWLGSLGHEIAQHTHFYPGTKITKAEKVDDLSKANVSHCIRRDFETLKGFGFGPRGFTAGSWLLNDAVLDTLVELGFVYDCSAQFPRPKASVPVLHNRWLRAPQYYFNIHGRVLCLPTICSLGEWFKWGRTSASEIDQFYQLVYLHDYDLLSLKGSIMLSCFLKVNKRRTLEQTASLAERCRVSGETLW